MIQVLYSQPIDGSKKIDQDFAFVCFVICTSQSCFNPTITSSYSNKDKRNLANHKNSHQKYTTRFSWFKLMVEEWP